MTRIVFLRTMPALLGALLLGAGCAHPCACLTHERTLSAAKTDGAQTTVETTRYLTYVPYRWYAPVIKPLAAVTLVAPIYSACRPHPHRDGRIGAGDRIRDFGAWFNIFSGIPTGPRSIVREDEPSRAEAADPRQKQEGDTSGKNEQGRADGEERR